MGIMKHFSIDIGGSSIKGAVIDLASDSEKMLFVTKEELGDNHIKNLILKVRNVIKTLIETEYEIHTLGICTTGSVSPAGLVLRAGFIDGYENFDWENNILPYFSQIENVFVLNDGQASTLGSFVNERLKSETLAHFVVGTGIGGGFLIDGKLVWGSHGFSGSFGHIKVKLDDEIICSCGKRGCVENYAASKAILRYARQYSTDKIYENITIRELSNMAKVGNKVAINAFNQAGYYLGIGISDIMNIIDPDFITIGGGIVEATHLENGENFYINSAIKTAQIFARSRIAEKVVIKESLIGNSCGLIGVAYYSQQKLTK
jgi:glucokinase